MQTLPLKTWAPSVSASKKYLSRLLTHKLATKLNSGSYEVLFETPLKNGDENEPDVVVFDKCQGWSSIMAIEICRTDQITDMLIIARDLMDKYSLLDFFLFDQDANNWYNIKRGLHGYDISSDAIFMGVDLDKLKD